MKPSASARPASKSTGVALATSTRARLWAGLCVASLAANGVLGWMVWHSGAASRTPSGAPAVADAKPTGELAPYAALGSFVAENNRIPDLRWSEEQFRAFQNGLRASYEGRGYAMDEDAKKLRDDINTRVQKLLAVDRPDPVQQYFKNLREQENVQQTPSGLHYRMTDVGTGRKPETNSRVLLSYSAKLPSGEALPALTRIRVRANLADLLPGLREGLQLFQVGGKGLVYVPAALSFGDGEWPADVPRGAPIVFFVELHEVQ